MLVFDGAMGTEIYRHHVFTNRSFDELCLSDPKLIRQIHADYRDAGADVLTTNTFGANRVALAKFGLAEKLPEIVRAGARLAREVADAAEPAGVRGRLDRPAARPSRSTRTLVEEMIVEQAEGLMEGGADFILFETQPNRDGPGAVRGGHAPPAGRALRALLRHRRATARRPPASRSSGCWPRLPPAAASRSPGA